MKRIELICVATFASFFIFYALSWAEIQLDSEFGKNGVVTTGFDIYNDEAKAIAVQKDGKIIVAGFTDNGANTDLAIARYNSDGSPDTDFNYTGKISLAIGSDDDSVNALTVQEDGKILLVGTSLIKGEKALILVRLCNDGLLDREFANDGYVEFDLGAGDDVAYDMILQTDGKILVAGMSQQEEKSRATVVRFNVDGSKDITFATEGVSFAATKSESVAYSLALQSDGKILITGYEKAETKTKAFVSRLLISGECDITFATDGIAYIKQEEEENAIAYDVALQDNQKILVVGSVQGSEYHKVLLTRFLEDGTPDNGFGESGTIQSDLGYDTIAYSLAIHHDSIAFVVGYGLSGESKDLALLQYDIHESDTSGDGDFLSVAEMTTLAENTDEEPSDIEIQRASNPTVILTDIEQFDDVGRAVLVQDNGQILTVGSSDNGKDTDFVVLRYISSVELYSDALSTGGIYYDGQYYISTIPISMVSRTSAATGGYIKTVQSFEEDDTVYITSRGVCYGITPHPVTKVAFVDDGDSSTTSSISSDVINNDSGYSHKEIPYNIIREGCTKDGSGSGTFRSDILRITPDTFYYVRAYLTLSDTGSTTYYGNELTFKTEDACFIATAAFGSPMESNVYVLRQFRDNYLKQSTLGRSFISLYYYFSPPVADFVRQHESLRTVTRVLLTPFVWFCSLL